MARHQNKNDSIQFKGICDGSAAVRLDKKTILVAYDELNTLFSYDSNGGAPLARAELATILNLKNSAEMDIEAATVSDQKIWWLGSHGLDKNGIIAPNRQMFFATNVPSTDLSDLKLLALPVDLSLILAKSEKFAKVLTETVRERPAKQGGINIEGLAATANECKSIVQRTNDGGKSDLCARRQRPVWCGVFHQGRRCHFQ